VARAYYARQKRIPRDMKFILYSDVGEGSIRDRLGWPEYSYFFVLNGFRKALAPLGDIVLVEDPARDVDPIYQACAERGEACVFFSFTPPHKTLVELRCPTIVVLAWEFDTIPIGGWDDDPLNDWRRVFAKLGRAICLSSYSAAAVRSAMGNEFPVATIAAPVPVPDAPWWPPPEGVSLRFGGTIVDSPSWGFRCDLLLPPLRPPRVEVEDSDEEDGPAELLDVDVVPFHLGVSDLLAPVALDRQRLLLELGQVPLHPMASALLAPGSVDRPLPLLAPEAVPLVEAMSVLLAPASVDAKPIKPISPPENLRVRLGITKRYVVAIYRKAIRDLLPSGAQWVVARAGRMAVRLARGRSVAPAPPPPETSPAPPEPMPVAAPTVAEPAAAMRVDPAPEPTLAPALPASGTAVELKDIRISGIVYTALVNPTDGRKNWMDLLTAFVYTFREVEDATLVIKIIHYDPKSYYDRLFVALSQLAPFKCRIISLYGYLETDDYEKLITATHFYLSAARAEGLCLPLMEFMACGKPAVTPLHTAMADYVDEESCFIVYSSREHNVWPHDTRALYTTYYYRVDWESLCGKLRESYDVATTMPERYRAMGSHAAERIRDFASVAAVTSRLNDFLAMPEEAPSSAPFGAAAAS
jgi:hypothetical protein